MLEVVRAAFVHGMDVSLVVAAGIALAGLVLTLVFLPAVKTAKAGGSASAEREKPLGITR